MINIFELDSKIENLVEKLNWFVEDKLNIKHRIFAKYIWILSFCIDIVQTAMDLINNNFPIGLSIFYSICFIVYAGIYTLIEYESKRNDNDSPTIATKIFIDMRFLFAFFSFIDIVSIILFKKHDFISIISMVLCGLSYYMISSISTPPKKQTQRQTGEIYEGV